jgi:hypothetical protein
MTPLSPITPWIPPFLLLPHNHYLYINILLPHKGSFSLLDTKKENKTLYKCEFKILKKTLINIIRHFVYLKKKKKSVSSL